MSNFSPLKSVLILALLVPVVAQAEDKVSPCYNLAYGIYNQSKNNMHVKVLPGQGNPAQSEFDVNVGGYGSVHIKSSTAYSLSFVVYNLAKGGHQVAGCDFMATPLPDGKSCKVQSICDTPADGYLVGLSTGINHEPFPTYKPVEGLNVIITPKTPTDDSASYPGLAATVRSQAA